MNDDYNDNCNCNYIDSDNDNDGDMIGIIGGTSAYEIGLKDCNTMRVETPFGEPSSSIDIGFLAGKKVAFLPRHGKKHQFLPHEINYGANIFALKKLGVSQILSLTTAGSLNGDIGPGSVVIPDQLVDMTDGRVSTFFGNGISAYIPFAQPFCSTLSAHAVSCAQDMGLEVHAESTYVCIGGPQFSTQAESRLYRLWGCDIVGMTACPEAKLAREAEMCYTSIVSITDMDVCGMVHDRTHMDIIRSILKNQKQLVQNIVKDMSHDTDCGCRNALRGSIVSRREDISKEVLERISPLLGKYNNANQTNQDGTRRRHHGW